MSRASAAGISRSANGKTVRSLLAVICGRKITTIQHTRHGAENDSKHPLNQLLERHSNGHTLPESRCNGGQVRQEFADLETAGHLEIHILEDPSKEELGRKLEKLHPDLLLLHGECLPGKEEIGGLVLRDGKVISSETLSSFFGPKVPNMVYLEISGLRLGEALRSQGVPYVIYWKGAPASSMATHFRRALVAALRSSATGPEDAYQIANASFQMHCGQTKTASVNGHENVASVVPMLIAVPPSKSSDEQTAESSGDDDGNETKPSEVAPVKIYDEETNIRLLVCSEASRPTSAWFGAIEDGLTALLTIEAKGVRLLHRVSAPPPPIAAASLHRGVVTMRCDVCTSSYARVTLLVSGAAQTCFDDHQLENSVRKELLDKCGQIRLFMDDDKAQAACLNGELRRSVSVACGASIVELKVKAPTWVGQVLRQLAAESSYRSLVALGIAGVEGAPVAAFQEEDAAHLVSLKRIREADSPNKESSSLSLTLPSWLAPPAASRKRLRLLPSVGSSDNLAEEDRKTSRANGDSGSDSRNSIASSSSKQSNFPLLAAMKPVPHTSRRKFMPFANAVMAAQHAGWSMKLDISNRLERKRQRRPDSARPKSSNFMLGPCTNQAIVGASSAQYTNPITPPVVKQHGCNRPHMADCSEDEFLQDLIHFLGSRGHSRLIPPAGFDAFPEVVLNGKRLDLYNLYREVVSRGGFHVGNGINWKGQIFAKMRNHTSVNKMTGVGNTLKKHYEVYLLEYELAHDDVDGECCILCHSGAEGDWVNCGNCGEWAHFGCDQRSGLGAFKDYAKTDGLDYICPRCSAGNGKPNSRRSKLKSPSEIPSPPTDLVPKTQKRS